MVSSNSIVSSALLGSRTARSDQPPAASAGLMSTTAAGVAHEVILATDPLSFIQTTRPTLIVALEGDWELGLSDSVIPLPAGSALPLNPGRRPRALSLGGGRCGLLIISFDPAIWGDLKPLAAILASGFLEARLTLDNEALQRCRHLGRQLLDPDTDPVVWEAMQMGLNQMLVVLANHTIQLEQRFADFPIKSRKRRREIFLRLLRVRDYIDARFMEDPPVERLAEVAHLSRAHFLRMYKSAFGTTPHQDLLSRKLQAAQDLLREDQLNITEIADAIGFKNRFTFYRVFHQRTGMSPSDYAQSCRCQ